MSDRDSMVLGLEGVRPLGETARSHMVVGVLTGRADESVETVLARARGASLDCADVACLVDPVGRLHGAASIETLLTAAPRTAFGDVADPAAPVTRPDTDQEEVAALACRHRIAAVPVVDDDRVLLGVVPPEAIIDVLRREHLEDMHRFVGIVDGNHDARAALSASPLRRARGRLPWLVVGLAGSMVATTIVASFEGRLEETVAVAFFIPAIVYLADAIGTQTEAVVVRGLSFTRASLSDLLVRELGAGLIIGAVLGALTVVAVAARYGDARLALAVGLAILVAGATATSVGLVFPWTLQRLGSDPAYGSGPVATIVQDVLSLVTYFAIVELLL